MKTVYKITLYAHIDNPGYDKDDMTEDIAKSAINAAESVLDNKLIVDPLMGEVSIDYKLEKLL